MPDRDAQILPAIARAAIADALDLPSEAWPVPASLRAYGASFVTLHRHGGLRGCIGSLMPSRPLVEDVRANAVAAAFQDFRFPPLSQAEFDIIDISVSVLGRAEPMPVTDEADAIARLLPGIDGLILEFGVHRGTFLPQVWKQLPDAADFLAQLKAKAGLPPDFWHADIRLSRYRVEEYAEGIHADD